MCSNMGGGGGGTVGLKDVKAYDITINGEKTTYTFIEHNGQTYYMRGFGDPQETPNGMSEKEFIERASARADVQPVSDADLRKRRSVHEQYRREMDSMLDLAYANDSHFVSGSRRSRLADRAQRRKRR